MGIFNATPDSFSDGGKYNHLDIAVERAKELIEHGADIIDVGGESTRPGSKYVEVEEELERVIPIISALAKEIKVPISIDTYKAEVAKQAIEAGATIINDVWGAKSDPDMAKIAAEYGVPIILMHNRKERNYAQLIPDMISDLYESITIAKQAGVKEENIVLDPGIGFAKTQEDNLDVMNALEHFTGLGYPVLLGTSRKSFIGHVLDVPPQERMEGTGATVCLGIQKGCQIVRVHDVKEIARMAKMMDAMMQRGGSTHR
jgi:dihydropteroate synthase